MWPKSGVVPSWLSSEVKLLFTGILRMAPHAQVYIALASFSCSQAQDGSCGCKNQDMLAAVGGNLCIYQPEPGVKIPTASPSRFLRAPFSGCEYIIARYCPPGFNGGDLGASCVANAGDPISCSAALSGSPKGIVNAAMCDASSMSVNNGGVPA